MNEMIDAALSKLEEEIRSGKKAMFGNGRTVDAGLCLDLIQQVREGLPGSIAEARVILQERDRLLGEAQQQANMLMDRARQQASQLVSQSNLLQQAQTEAARIVEQANRYRNETTQAAYQEIAGVFQSAEYYLRNSLDNVTASRQELIGLMQQPPKPQQ